MTRSDLVNLSNTNVADAPPSNITAAGVRSINNNLISSNATLDDANTFTESNTFNQAVTCFADLYTGYQLALTPQTTIDLTAVIGNYLEISGSFDTISNFGNCVGGEIRFLKFYDPCQLSPVGNIVLPTGQLINVEANDTCTVCGKDDGTWIVTNYQRASGLPVAASVVQSWTVNSAAPTVNEFNPPYLLGYRWVSQESAIRRKEWISDNDASSAAVWNPMAGSFGVWGDGKDLEINGITPVFSGIPFIGFYDIRYKRISNLLLLSGEIEVSEIDGTGGYFDFDFTNNNQGLNIDPDTMVGWGYINQNGFPVEVNGYSVFTLNTQKLYVETSNAWASDTIRVKFKITVFIHN